MLYGEYHRERGLFWFYHNGEVNMERRTKLTVACWMATPKSTSSWTNEGATVCFVELKNDHITKRKYNRKTTHMTACVCTVCSVRKYYNIHSQCYNLIVQKSWQDRKKCKSSQFRKFFVRFRKSTIFICGGERRGFKPFYRKIFKKKCLNGPKVSLFCLNFPKNA